MWWLTQIRSWADTHTEKIKIDIGNNAQIKLRPYRTPNHKRPLVEEADRDMLKLGIVERIKSPQSFPIVVVDKEDGGQILC